MKISLVTTCFNEANSFAGWKQDVLNQTRPPDEIIIVDSESNDGTIEFLNAWAREDNRVRITIEKCRPAYGRNLAVSQTTTDIVISTDCGCRLDQHWVERICQPFEDNSDVAVVVGNYGPDLSTMLTPVAWAAYFLANEYKTNLGPGFLPSNRSVAYRRWAWDFLGGLPEDLTFAGDDTVLGIYLYKSKLKIAYAYNAYVWWGRHNTWREYCREEYRYGYGNGEAGLSITPIVSLVIRGWPKVFLVFSVLIVFLRKLFLTRLIIKFVKSIRSGGVSAGALFFPLLFAVTYNNLMGLVDGFVHGSSACLKTRRRLSLNT